jgi:hypothetical protein
MKFWWSQRMVDGSWGIFRRYLGTRNRVREGSQ